jgi:hypothetical protein
MSTTDAVEARVNLLSLLVSAFADFGLSLAAVAVPIATVIGLGWIFYNTPVRASLLLTFGVIGLVIVARRKVA